jgi:uncharacterized membrane protein YccC
MTIIREWFGPAATWREKSTALATQLAETAAARESLEREAAGRLLSAGPRDEKIARIEQEIHQLASRERILQRAGAEAETLAQADEAAAEAERQRQAAEARRRRIAELSQGYGAKAAKVAEAARALIVALDEAAAAGAQLGEAAGTDEARRMLGPGAIANRYRHTLWRSLHGWFPYAANEAHPEMKMDLVEREREILAELHKQTGGE